MLFTCLCFVHYRIIQIYFILSLISAYNMIEFQVSTLNYFPSKYNMMIRRQNTNAILDLYEMKKCAFSRLPLT